MSDRPPTGAEVAAGVGAVLEVYDAALDVMRTWLEVPVGDRLPNDHDRAVIALVGALAAAGVLERDSRLDPAAVSRLSPRPQPDAPGVIGPAPDAG